MKREQASLAALADREAIREMIYRYCRALDRSDVVLGYSVFHEDSEADYGPIYSGSGRGFIDFSLGSTKGLNCSTHHQVSNITIQLDGDRASSEAYVLSTFRMLMGEQQMQSQSWARYIDQWSCRAGEWRISKRLAITDFDTSMAEVKANPPSPIGQRNREDPSFAALREPS
jgi:hypothetical protein